MRSLAALLLLLLAGVSTGQSAAFSHSAAPIDLTTAAYRYFHENPELGKREALAHYYIVARINEIGGLQIEAVPSLPTAVIAVLDSGTPGPTIALRADMDARRLDEGAEEPAHHSPRSRIPGLMHNCGHDAHSAMLLGALAQLARERATLSGKIVFVFQPAEETRGGADDIIASGVLQRLGVQAIFAQHAAPGLAVGEVSLGGGLAGSTTFRLTLHGTAVHAAIPYEGSDLALTGARFVEALATLPAHGWDMANRPAVITVTRINTPEGTVNATPAEITIEGTIRAFEPLERADNGPSISSIINQRVQALATLYGVRAELSLTPGAPPTINDQSLANTMIPALQRSDRFRLTTSRERGMFAEDFAFYTSEMPALYFALGIARDSLGSAPVHTSAFTIHPDALPIGIDFLVSLARSAGSSLPLGSD